MSKKPLSQKRLARVHAHMSTLCTIAAHTDTPFFFWKEDDGTFFDFLCASAAHVPLDLVTFRRTLDVMRFTPTEYETLLCASLSASSTAALRWQSIYQSAEGHGIQPSTQALIQQFAERAFHLKEDQREACFQILKERGVALDTRDERGMTPLMHAFSFCPWHESLLVHHTLDALCAPWLERGQGVTTIDYAGNTFLHHVGARLIERTGRPEKTLHTYCATVRFLLKQGVDVQARNYEGLVAHEAVRKRLLFKYPEGVSKKINAIIQHLEQSLDEAVLHQTLAPDVLLPPGTGKRRRL